MAVCRVCGAYLEGVTYDYSDKWYCAKCVKSDNAKSPIYSVHGTKLIYSNPDAGLDGDQQTAKRWLKVGGVYTVDRVLIGGYSTHISFNEIPSVFFNSVLFEKTED